MSFFEPAVVLVGTLYESNIGATSRAMANMGVNRLILINRQCEITFQAQQAAATGQAALQNRTEYSSWQDFFQAEPEGVRIALTARSGRLRDVQDLSTQLDQLKSLPTESTVRPIYFIFGPEDAGLSFEDLKQAHFSCSIPIYGQNPSLNLAQATLLALFIFRQSQLSDASIQNSSTIWKENIPVDRIHLPRLEQVLKNWLLALGFELREQHMSAYTVLRRLLLHSVPNQKELKMLDVILNQSVRKLNELAALKDQENQSKEKPEGSKRTARIEGDSLEHGPASGDDPSAPIVR